MGLDITTCAHEHPIVSFSIFWLKLPAPDDVYALNEPRNEFPVAMHTQ
jgi:hypothetical protein